MRRTTTFLSLALAAANLAGPGEGVSQTVGDTLVDLSRALAESQMEARRQDLLLAHSVAAYTVVAPGGVVESRDQVVSGIPAFATVDSITFGHPEVVLHEGAAVVFDRLTIHGAVQGPAAPFTRLSVTTTFARASDGRWLALARTLTPCHPRAVEAGRC